MAFCRQCGSPVGEVKFCSKCGAAVLGAPGAGLAPPAPTIPSQAAPPTSAAPQPVPAPGSLLVKVLVAFLVFILLVILAVMGSCVYIGYRAKKKADEIQQAYKTNDLNKLAGALGVGSTKHAGGSSGGSSSEASSDSGEDRLAQRRFLFRRGPNPPREANLPAKSRFVPGLR